MRSGTLPLLAVLRSRHQGAVLASVLLQPNKAVTVSELARALNSSSWRVRFEVRRLLKAKIFSSDRRDGAHLISVNKGSRLVGPLTDLIAPTFGPPVLVKHAFTRLSDVDTVLIFGSWAKRHFGVAGSEPNDLDILVVGSPDRRAAYTAAAAIEDVVRFPVNVVVRTLADWISMADPLLLEISENPHLYVIGGTPKKG